MGITFSHPCNQFDVLRRQKRLRMSWYRQVSNQSTMIHLLIILFTLPPHQCTWEDCEHTNKLLFTPTWNHAPGSDGYRCEQLHFMRSDSTYEWCEQQTLLQSSSFKPNTTTNEKVHSRVAERHQSNLHHSAVIMRRNDFC